MTYQNNNKGNFNSDATVYLKKSAKGTLYYSVYFNKDTKAKYNLPFSTINVFPKKDKVAAAIKADNFVDENGKANGVSVGSAMIQQPFNGQRSGGGTGGSAGGCAYSKPVGKVEANDMSDVPF